MSTAPRTTPSTPTPTTTPTPGTSHEARTGVQSLHRALDLLEVVEASGGHLSLAELAAAVDLAPATVHRLLRTLLERGYVRQRPDRRYALGFRLVPLGTAATSLVAETAGGVLADLVDELGETANLAVLSGHQAEYVAQVPSAYSMRMFTRVGHRVALHCTGVGKAMLAHAAPALVEQVLAAPLPTPTPYTLGTPDDAARGAGRRTPPRVRRRRAGAGARGALRGRPRARCRGGHGDLGLRAPDPRHRRGGRARRTGTAAGRAATGRGRPGTVGSPLTSPRAARTVTVFTSAQL